MVSVAYWARVSGPLEAHVEGFRGELERLGYTPLSAAAHMRLMAHLSRWMAREGFTAAALTVSRVDAYFAERRAAGYVNERTARALQPRVGPVGLEKSNSASEEATLRFVVDRHRGGSAAGLALLPTRMMIDLDLEYPQATVLNPVSSPTGSDFTPSTPS